MSANNALSFFFPNIDRHSKKQKNWKGDASCRSNWIRRRLRRNGVVRRKGYSSLDNDAVEPYTKIITKVFFERQFCSEQISYP